MIFNGLEIETVRNWKRIFRKAISKYNFKYFKKIQLPVLYDELIFFFFFRIEKNTNKEDKNIGERYDSFEIKVR